MTWDTRSILPDSSGIADCIRARIFVPDDAAPAELAAAANIAARIAFESQSLDLPVGFPISEYDPSDACPAILVGRAALATSRGNALALPDPSQAEEFARTLGIERYTPGSIKRDAKTAGGKLSLSNVFSHELRLVIGSGVKSPLVIDLAARIGLELAQLRLPLAVVEASQPLNYDAIVIGYSSRIVAELVKTSRFPASLPAGAGRVQVVENAVGAHTVVAIAGADHAGESEAIRHAAYRLPNVWDYGKEYLSLKIIERDIRAFVSRRSTAGQAAAALSIAAATETGAGPALSAEISADGLSFRTEAGGPSLDVVTQPPLVFEDVYDLRWEVDDALNRIRARVLPRVTTRSAVVVDLRLSEAPEVCDRLEADILSDVLRRGAEPSQTSVRVLCAHKQGYSWIHRELKPKLQGCQTIRIRFRELHAESGFVDSPLRWLQEIYPIDEVLARDLGIHADSVIFEKLGPEAEHIYEVLAFDGSGQRQIHATFNPQYVRRPLFDQFPGYASACVATGWIRAAVDDAVVLDERVRTDAERFWDAFQSSALPKLHDYILALYGGRPRPECAPHFDTLTVEVALSEPDYRIGVDEERISTLEALHEDLYFETLLFLDVMGLTYANARLTYPGRIIPMIQPSREGAGWARVRLRGKSTLSPSVTLRWSGPDETSRERTEELFPLTIEPPRVTGMDIRAGHRGVTSLDVTIPLPCPEGFADGLRKLRHLDLDLDWLCCEDVDQIRLLFTDREEGVLVPQARDGRVSIHPRIVPAEATPPIVQWDAPIGPDECAAVIQRLAAFPEVRAYWVGQSYLGRRIWAMDVMSPNEGRFLSQVKARLAKPVLLVTGRQHANEVSSTSHILKLVELLVRGPERGLLDRVTVVAHPITNPDGAALIDELSPATPDFMLHAAYLGALGVDVTHQQWADQPKYPEAGVRADLWHMWQPDIVLNPHGYPSHEWVQLFAGYAAWFRSRDTIARDWWIPRGWFLPHFEYGRHREASAKELLNRVAEGMKAVIEPLNAVMYPRYLKYAALDPGTPKVPFYGDLMVSLQPKDRSAYSDVTLLDVVSEAPDEVARGPWLRTIAKAGLEFSLIHARFLAEREPAVERTVEVRPGETLFLISRAAI